MGSIAIIIPATILLAFGLMALLDATRGTPISEVTARGEEAPPRIDEPVFRHLMEAYTGVALREGHALEIVVNGDGTYPRLWADLRAARSFIALQMYYWHDGRLAREVRDILVERARAGVQVQVLYDAFGSTLPGEYVRALRDGGIDVRTFRPFRLQRLHMLHHRAHLRAIVIDGTLGWTGGFGFDDKWMGDGRHPDHWRDTNVRFTGPAVSQLLATFASCWAETTGELLAGRRHWAPNTEHPDEARADRPVCGLVHGMPTVGSTPAERFVTLAIAGARRTLYFTTAYFVGDDDFRRLVKDAAARGVDVRILTAGDHSDVKSTRWAARARYEELLAGGVRVYEYAPSMIHAKTIVVDGVWGTVGTMNLDNRSMAFNNECTLMAFDPEFAATLERLFHEDLAHANEIDLETFRRRPLWRKMVEHGAHALSRVL